MIHREYQDAPSPMAEGLESLLLFFTHASVRMAQISRPRATDAELES